MKPDVVGFFPLFLKVGFLIFSSLVKVSFNVLIRDQLYFLEAMK